MFLKYYGLREQPFSTTPDPRYLYMSASHREALASLIYGIETGRGFVSLIAEPGMGKTTLLFQLLDRFRNSARTVFLFQTQGNTREFLVNLVSDLGVVPDDRDLSSLQRQLNDILVQEARLGRQFVLVIDEAQNLEDPVLESVRMLSNFETSRSKLMQIVLAGQPGLADKLARPDLEQLMQRVSVICRLKPFNRQEVADYIDHRLRVAGYKGGRRFTPEALAMVTDLSEGIPRNINNICFHALSLGYAKGQKMIDREVIEEVYGDLELETLKNTHEEPQRNVRRESFNGTLGLEGITLNRIRLEREDKEQFVRGGRYSPPTYPGMVGGGWPRRQAPRWPFWALTLLMLVLAGELFWAQLPTGARNHLITGLVAKAVGTAKSAAGTESAKTNGSSEAGEPQTTVIGADTHANGVPAPVSKGADEATAPVDIEAAKTDSTGAGNENQASSDAANTDEAAAAGNSPVPAKPGSGNGDSVLAADPASVPTGTIVLESNVRGGIVTINGETNPSWRTPHMFDLPEGMYRISVSREGYETWYKVLRVSAGNKRWVTADLQLPRGVIVIDTEPPGMQVFIDGKAYGPSEVEAALDAGEHEFKVVPTGSRRPFQGSFVLKPGDILTRKIRWPAQAPQPTAGNTPAAQKLKTNGKPAKEREAS